MQEREDIQEEQNEPKDLPKKKKTFWRRFLIGFSIFLLLAIVTIYILFIFYLNPYVKSQLIQSVKKSTNGLYELEVEDLKINVLSGNLRIEKVILHKNEKIWKKLLKDKPKENHLDLDLSVNKVNVTKIKWWKFWQEKELSIGKVYLEKPDIYFKNHISKYEKRKENLPKKLLKIIKGFTKKLDLQELVIQEANIKAEALADDGSSYHQGDSINVYLKDIDIQTNQETPIENFSIKNYTINFKDYLFKTPDQVYELRIDNFNLSSVDSLITIQDILLKPHSVLNLNQQKNIKKYNATRIDATLLGIDLHGLDFDRLLYKQEVALRKLHFTDLDLKINVDKNLAKKQIQKQQNLKKILRELPFYIRMDTLLLDNSTLNYEVRHKANNEQKLTYHKADSIHVLFKNIALGKAITKENNNKPLYSEGVSVAFKNYEYQTLDGIYRFNIADAKVSSLDSLIRIKRASLKPLVSQEVFASKKYYQTIMTDVKVEDVLAYKIDVERLAYQQEFLLQSLHLYKPDFKAFLDSRKSKKPKQRFQNFEQFLQSIPLFVKMDTLAIHEAKMNFTEFTLKESGQGIAHHKADNINLHIQKIDLGSALQESALENIDTKSLILSLENYNYQSANGIYELELEKLVVSSTKSTIKIDSLKLKPLQVSEEYFDEQIYRKALLDLDIGSIEGEKVDFKRLLLFQEFDWGYLHMNNPNVRLIADKTKPKRPKIRDSLKLAISELALAIEDLAMARDIPKKIYQSPQEKKPKRRLDLRQVLKEIPAFIKIDTFTVNGGSIYYQEKNQKKEKESGMAYHKAENINFIIPQITLGKATTYVEDSSKVQFYSQNILFTLQNYEFKDKNDKYKFNLTNIESSLADSIMLIQELHFRPLLSKDKFIAQHPFRSVFLDAKLKSIQADALDYDRLIFENEFVLNSLSINKPEIELYSDKNKPQKPNKKVKTAEEILRSIPMYISIDTFKVRQAKLEYNEKIPLKNFTTSGFTQHKIGNINLLANNIELALDKSSQKREAPNNLLYSDKIFLTLEDYTFTTPDSTYQVLLDKFESVLTDSTFSLNNLKIKPLQSVETFDETQEYSGMHWEAKIDKVQANQIDFRKLLNNTGYQLEAVFFKDIDLNIYHNKTLPKKQKLKPKTPEEIFKEIHKLVKVDTFALQNITLNYTEKLNYNNEVRLREHTADNINLTFLGIEIDSNSLAKPENLFYSKDIHLSLQNYKTPMLDGFYKISLGSLEASTKDEFIELGGFQYIPTLSKRQFARKKLYQTDRFKASTEKIRLNSLNFRKLINHNEVELHALDINELTLEIYRDKRYVRDSTLHPNMPHLAFQKIPIKFKLDTFRLSNSSIRYTEKVPKGVGEGSVFFTDMNVEALHIDTQADTNTLTNITAEARLLDEGQLHANINIPLNKPTLYCDYSGQLGKMDATFFNQIIENNEHVKIKKGNIHKVKFKSIIQDTLTTGEVAAGYRKLKIQVLRADDHNKKRGFITFLGNWILRGRNNLSKRRHKVGEVEYYRKEYDSFLAVLWRSLATGLVDTLK